MSTKKFVMVDMDGAEKYMNNIMISIQSLMTVLKDFEENGDDSDGTILVNAIYGLKNCVGNNNMGNGSFQNLDKILEKFNETHDVTILVNELQNIKYSLMYFLYGMQVMLEEFGFVCS